MAASLLLFRMISEVREKDAAAEAPARFEVTERTYSTFATNSPVSTLPARLTCTKMR
jgi:hypothetical protein